MTDRISLVGPPTVMADSADHVQDAADRDHQTSRPTGDLAVNDASADLVVSGEHADENERCDWYR